MTIRWGRTPSSSRSTSSAARAVAADQPVVAEHPEVARTRDGVHRRLRRALLGALDAVQGPRKGTQLLVAEPEDRRRLVGDVEQVADLDLEQIVVPARVRRDLVVSEGVGAALCLCPCRAVDHRDISRRQRLAVRKADFFLSVVHLLDRHVPTVTGRDHAAVVEVGQDRVGEAEGPDRCLDLFDLVLRMRPCVPLVEGQVGQPDQPDGDARLFLSSVISLPIAPASILFCSLKRITDCSLFQCGSELVVGAAKG